MGVIGNSPHFRDNDAYYRIAQKSAITVAKEQARRGEARLGRLVVVNMDCTCRGAGAGSPSSKGSIRRGTSRARARASSAAGDWSTRARAC